MRDLKASERLIVAADFVPPEEGHGLEPGLHEGDSAICNSKIGWVRKQVLELADSLADTGVCLKVNSALRACGYSLISEIHSRGVKVFADLKLYDIGNTLATDGVLLREAKPEFVTVACVTGVDAMSRLAQELPNTEVLGVTVLTTFSQEDSQAMFMCSTEEAVLRLARIASSADAVDGLILSAKEADLLRSEFGALLSMNTPGIRPEWAIVDSDDQDPNRIMTPTKAIQAGVDRIVIGRPIVQAEDRRGAVIRTIEEISSAMETVS